MNKFFVTTSRGWLADVTDTAELAYAACRKLREQNNIDYKVVRPTKYRIILGNPVELSILPDANIVIENGIAYSYISDSYFNIGFKNNDNSLVCPYTGAIGKFDKNWYEQWED